MAKTTGAPRGEALEYKHGMGTRTRAPSGYSTLLLLELGSLGLLRRRLFVRGRRLDRRGLRRRSPKQKHRHRRRWMVKRRVRGVFAFLYARALPEPAAVLIAR
eukprot:scaffold121427_cov60-Phaeocystis_antarctica.AAC.1